MSTNDDAMFSGPLQTVTSVFGIRGRVSRQLYACVGFGLMAVKYAIECVLIFVWTGQFFSPVTFIVPSLTMRESLYSAAPSWLPWAIVVWSLPFIWIAVTMSVRRAIDAGRSPWLGLLVLVPIINLLTMISLALAPSADAADPQARLKAQEESKVSTAIFSACLGTFVGGLFAFVTTLISVYTLDSYGGSLFLGMPIVAGTVAGYVFNQPAIRGIVPSIAVGALSVALGGFGLMLFAFEGVICLLMATPLIAPLGALGGLLGWAFAKTILVQSKWMLGGAFLVVPFLAIIESELRTYRVDVAESSVVINAPPEVVWQNVIAFPDITARPAWYFQMGVACPLRARIEGTGVNAVRHCEFTTGDFVEPITVWDQPHRLAFDVTDQPDALVELTPYREVRPPHLQHSFRSVQGEFELIDLQNGRTRLVGRTWYTIDMGPRIYWRFWTNEIIHRIHLRVLDHIKEQSE